MTRLKTGAAAAALAISMSVSAATDTLVRINNDINSKYAYTTDHIYNWRPYSEFVKSGEGDCKDYSLAKFIAVDKALPELPKKLVFVDHVTGGIKTAHMVLMVEYNQTNYLLDNLMKGIYTQKDRTDLIPKLSMEIVNGSVYVDVYDRNWNVVHRQMANEVTTKNMLARIDSVSQPSYEYGVSMVPDGSNRFYPSSNSFLQASEPWCDPFCEEPWLIETAGQEYSDQVDSTTSDFEYGQLENHNDSMI